MTQHHRGSHGTPERHQVRNDVIDGGDERPVEDVRNRDHETARKGDRQEKADHDTSLLEELLRVVDAPDLAQGTADLANGGELLQRFTHRVEDVVGALSGLA